MQKIFIFLILFLMTATFVPIAKAEEYYVKIPEVVSMAEKVHAKHILVKTEDEAKDIKARIDKGESFEDLAQEYSLCPSKREGGDLGWFGRGVMVPEFEKGAFDTDTGKISDPIQTQFGWHLIKVIDKK